MTSDGFPAGVVAFAENLRAEGLAVGTSELLDAFAALGEVSWTEEPAFREALAATLAKSPEDRRVFDLVFDRFFFRAAEEAAMRQGVREQGAPGAGAEDEDGITGGDQIDYDNLREQLLQAIRDGDESAMRDLARLAIVAFGRRGEGSGVLGVDVQRIRRALGLRSEPGGPPPRDPDAPPAPALTRDQIRRFEQLLRRELERAQIERTQALPPSRPLNELDRALPSGPLQDLAAVHRVVAQLKRRLATQGHETRGRKRHAHVDVRRTMRASLQTGGVPVVLKYRPRRPKRPELYVLCDVSTSVTSASVFFLSVLHALHDAFRKMRSFVFVERISEVTEVFERERSFKAVSDAISKDAGVADVSGYTDYGRVWREFLAQVADDLHPRATVIVLGDARTNGRDPRADVFASIVALAGRTFWLNPEPRLYWNYGDSVISAYEQHCDAYECWTTRQLEDFVKALTRPYAEQSHDRRQRSDRPRDHRRQPLHDPQHRRCERPALGLSRLVRDGGPSPLLLGLRSECEALAQPRRAAGAGDRDLRLDRRPRRRGTGLHVGGRRAGDGLGARGGHGPSSPRCREAPGPPRLGARERPAARPPSPLPRDRIRALPAQAIDRDERLPVSLSSSAARPGPERLDRLLEALELLLARRGPVEAVLGRLVHLLRDEHGARARAAGQAAGDVDGRAEPVAPAVDGRAVGDARPQRREVSSASARSTSVRQVSTAAGTSGETSITASPICLTTRTGDSTTAPAMRREPAREAAELLHADGLPQLREADQVGERDRRLRRCRRPCRVVRSARLM